MKTVGYINGLKDDNFEKIQLEAMLKMGVQEIHFEREYFYDKDKWKKGITIDKMTDILQEGDTLVIYELRCLELSVIQLSEFFLFIEHMSIEILTLKYENGFSDLCIKKFIDVIRHVS